MNLSPQDSQLTDEHQLKASAYQPIIKTKDKLRYALVYEGDSKQRHQKGQVLIVLVAGVPGSERDYRYLTPLLNQWAPVVRVILPGFGILSDEAQAPASGMERALYLKAVADAEQWQKLLIVGHSMGGIACTYWASIDQRVRSLALLCSVGIKMHRGMAFGANMARFLLGLMRLPIIKTRIQKRFREAMVRMGFKSHVLDSLQLRLILQHVVHLNFKDVKKRLHAQYLAGLDQISMLYCFDDPIVDFEASKALMEHLQQQFPQEKLVIRCIDKGGHNPQKHKNLEVDHWLHSLYTFYT